jgi:prephenate dehydratase
LKILYSNIQNQEKNYTRFIALKAGDKALAEPVLYAAEAKKEYLSDLETGQKFGVVLKNLHSSYKTSFIVYLEKQRPGELYEIIKAFAEREINLTMIDSRPSKKIFGDYYFYVDFEGRASNKDVKNALKDIGIVADTLKVLVSGQLNYATL